MLGTGLDQSNSNSGHSDALNSIRSSNADAVEALRAHRRFDIRTKVVIQPSDSIDRTKQQWLGECHDISKGGCRILTQQPLQLGSVYWIQFDPTKIQIDPVFARCVRGQLLRESAFEFGMSFLSTIELPQSPEPEENETSLI